MRHFKDPKIRKMWRWLNSVTRACAETRVAFGFGWVRWMWSVYIWEDLSTLDYRYHLPCVIIALSPLQCLFFNIPIWHLLTRCMRQPTTSSTWPDTCGIVTALLLHSYHRHLKPKNAMPRLSIHICPSSHEEHGRKDHHKCVLASSTEPAAISPTSN